MENSVNKLDKGFKIKLKNKKLCKVIRHFSSINFFVNSNDFYLYLIYKFYVSAILKEGKNETHKTN